MDLEERADEVLAAWVEARESGVAPAPAEVLRAHPDLAPLLRRAFVALKALDAHEEPTAGEAPGPTTAPARLGDYRLLGELGRGGMGIVYEAEQVSMGRTVALKVLYPSFAPTENAAERFRREAQATGRLQHTNIVQIYGMGCDEGRWYYAMERVRGRSLAAILDDAWEARQTAPPPAARHKRRVDSTPFSSGAGDRTAYARVALTFAGLAEGLAAAHAAGVIHRDVKPSNLMLDEKGTLKVLDFGLAAFQREPQQLTLTGDLVGTPAYMSPEQATGGEVDGRTDVWALGVTLYETLTLRLPFDAADPLQTVRAVVGTEPVAPRRLEPRVPRDLETIVLKALEKDPARRYASAHDLARDLRAFAEGAAIAARRVGPVGRAWRVVRRHRVRSALVVALLLVAAAALAFAASAREQGRGRARLQVDALLIEAARGLLGWGSTGSSEGTASTRRAEHLLAEAEGLAPDRPEVPFARWLYLQHRPLDARLADIERAFAGGLLSDRARGFARAQVLESVADHARAGAERARAEAQPASTDAVSLLVEAYAVANIATWPRVLELIAATERLPLPAFLVDWRTGLKGWALEGLGDPVGAIEAVGALGAVPTPGIRAWLASLWARTGGWKRARTLLDETLAEAEAARDPALWHELVAQFDRRRDFWALETVTRRAVEALPSDVELATYRALALARLGFPVPQIREAARAAATRLPRAEEGASLLGALLCSAGDLETGRPLLEEGLRESPQSPLPLGLLAWADFAAGRREPALRTLHALLQAHPDDGRVVVPLVQCLREAGQAEEALALATRLADLVSLDPGHRQSVAAVQLDLGRPRAALETAERVLSMAPDHPRALEARAQALLGLGRAREALECLRPLARVLPGDLRGPRLRGEGLMILGRAMEAEEQVRAALATADPSDPAAPPLRALHARLQLVLGRPAEALTGVEEALADARRVPAPWGQTGPARRVATEAVRVLRALGRFAEARARLAASDRRALDREIEALDALLALDLGTELGRSEAPPLTVTGVALAVRALRRSGRPEEAEALARGWDPGVDDDGSLVWGPYVLAVAGRRAEAERLLGVAAGEGLLGLGYPHAVARAALGDREGALALLATAVGAEPIGGAFEGELAPLSSDPRFSGLRSRLTPPP